MGLLILGFVIIVAFIFFTTFIIDAGSGRYKKERNPKALKASLIMVSGMIVFSLVIISGSPIFLILGGIIYLIGGFSQF